MTLLTESEAKQVADKITEVEQHTDAELVAVLARKADDYNYIPTLWAALIAIVSPGLVLFSPLWVGVADVMIIQMLVFLVLAFLLRIPFILQRIIPGPVKRHRASNLAYRQFLENNLHYTKGETGLLIFVSETEHYVQIIADRGISKVVPDAEWKKIVDHLTGCVKSGKTLLGFLDTVEACGLLLAEHIPSTGEQDELPNRLVMLD